MSIPPILTYHNRRNEQRRRTLCVCVCFAEKPQQNKSLHADDTAKTTAQATKPRAPSPTRTLPKSSFSPDTSSGVSAFHFGGRPGLRVAFAAASASFDAAASLLFRFLLLFHIVARRPTSIASERESVESRGLAECQKDLAAATHKQIKSVRMLGWAGSGRSRGAPSDGGAQSDLPTRLVPRRGVKRTWAVRSPIW